MYPKEAFVSRSLFGVSIKSIGENTLKAYIHDFIKSIEEIHNKGILHSITISVLKENNTIENFLVKIDWLMNMYGLSDNDKILSPSNKDFIFSSVLSDLYSNPIKNYDGESFQLIVWRSPDKRPMAAHK